MFEIKIEKFWANGTSTEHKFYRMTHQKATEFAVNELVLIRNLKSKIIKAIITVSDHKNNTQIFNHDNSSNRP